MSGPDGRSPDRDRLRYRRLLRVFPPDFRERWGAEMEDTFLRHLHAARRRGGAAAAAVWVRAAWDAATRGGARRLGWGVGPRDRDRTGVVSALRSDVHFAVRSLRRRPVFAVTAVLTLALAIGANTAVFSLVRGLLLRPLPYPEADRLVTIWSEHRERGWSETDVNAADAWDIRARAGVYEELALFDEAGVTLTGLDRPELLPAVVATPNLFDVLGVTPALGRGFTAADAREGAPRVAVLAHGFWERRLGGDPDALGRPLELDGTPVVPVGVLGPDFRFLDERPDVFLVLPGDPAATPRGGHDKEALGRLLPGVGLERAREATDRVALWLQEEHPESNAGWTTSVVSLRSRLLGDMAREASLVLMAAVGFVLVMACVNVANLLLARAEARRSEIAMRIALGARRGRILGQLLVESLVLGAAGGALGLALAVWGRAAIVAGLPETLPPVFDISLDRGVLLFGIAVSLGASLAFGLVPALRASDRRAHGYGGRGRGRGGRRFGGALVVAQTAVAAVLLVGGGVMARTVVNLTSQDMGFEPRGVLTARVSLAEERYPEAADANRLWSAYETRVRALPGVTAAGTIQSLPLAGSNWGGTFWTEDQDPAADEGSAARFGYVSPGYFEAMGIDLVRGRPPGAADEAEDARTAWVNEPFVRRFMAGGEVVGAVLRTSGAHWPVTVVGVVERHVERALDRPVDPAIYLPVATHGLRDRTLVVRTTGDPAAVVDGLRASLEALDPTLPLHSVRSMEEWIDVRVGGFRLIAGLMAGFAGISLLLGAVGIYGVTAYTVGRRSREIGVRMAMGADRREVVGLVVREGMLRTALGLVLGLALAWLLSRAMGAMLVGVGPRDPLTFGAVAATLAAVGLLGSWLPARRASRVSPVEALAAD